MSSVIEGDREKERRERETEASSISQAFPPVTLIIAESRAFKPHSYARILHFAVHMY